MKALRVILLIISIPFLTGCGSKNDLLESSIVTPGDIALGRELYLQYGCAVCHWDPSKGQNAAAPSLFGIYGERVRLEDGRTVKRDEAYMYRAVHDSIDEIVKGYRPEMMPYGEIIPAEELEKILVYLKSI